MAGQAITTTQIDNASMTYIEKMTAVRDHEGVTNKTAINKTLPPGYGLNFHWPYVGSMTAAPIVDGEPFMNASTMSDTDVVVTAARYGVQTLISKFSNVQTKEDLFALAGKLQGSAMTYKLDRSGLIAYQGFGGLLGSSTATLVVGHVDAAATAIRTGLVQSGATARTGARDTGDPSEGELYCVLHDRQIRALRAQLSGLFSGSSDGAISTTAPTMGHGTNRVGLSEYQQKWFTEHNRGMILGGVRVWADNNILINSDPSAKGYIAAKGGMLHLNYDQPFRADMPTEDGLYRRITLADAWGFGVICDAWGYVLQSSAAGATS